MRPNLHRGKAPAPGILYAPERMRAEFRTGPDGEPVLIKDPRGYWDCQRYSDKPPSRRDRHRMGDKTAKCPRRANTKD